MSNERYILQDLLGKGGMGEVYLAEDTLLKRTVAIKRIHGNLASNPQFLERLQRESVLHARVGVHPNIVSILDRVDKPNEILIVMEYVQGLSLRELMDDPALAPTPTESVLIILQLLQALEAIQTHKIIHRDIKPENIMIIKEESGYRAKLLDFGIARGGGELNLTLPMEGSPGTPVYMSPEMISPQDFGEITLSVDVYAVGILLYESLSGRPPFQGHFNEVLTGHLRHEPSSIPMRNGQPIPIPVWQVLLKALAKMPKDRYANATEMRLALSAASGIGSSSNSGIVRLPSSDTVSQGNEKIPIATAAPPAQAASGNPTIAISPSSSSSNVTMPVGSMPPRTDDPKANKTIMVKPQTGNQALPSGTAKVGKRNSSNIQVGKMISLVVKAAIALAVVGGGIYFAKDYLEKEKERKKAIVEVPVVAEADVLAGILAQIQNPQMTLVREKCVAVLNEIKPFTEDFAPSVDVSVSGAELDTHTASEAKVRIAINIDSNYKDVLYQSVYLRHVDAIGEQHEEALQWMSLPQPFEFELDCSFDGGSWRISRSQLAGLSIPSDDSKQRVDFQALKERSTPDMFERNFGIKAMVAHKKYLSDRNLAKFLENLEKAGDDFKKLEDSEKSQYQRSLNATATARSLREEANRLSEEKAPREQVQRLLQRASEQTKIAAEAMQISKIDGQRKRPLGNRADWLMLAFASYAIGKRYKVLAEDCLSKVEARDPKALEFAQILRKRHQTVSAEGKN